MSYSEDRPFARVTCRLSAKGVLDAVRNGLVVDADGTATFWIRSGEDLWPRIFELDPEPVSEDDGRVETIQLQVGRVRRAVVNPSKASYARWYGPEIFAWRQPAVTIEYGPQEPIDSCGGVEQLLDLEESLVGEFRPALTAVQEDDLPRIMTAWREWVSGEGISNAEELHRFVDALLAEATTISPVLNAILRDSSQSLGAAIEMAKSSPTDDAFAILMEIVFTTEDDIDNAEARLEKERGKRAELADAEHWVGVHGSARLKKAVEVGILRNSMGAYRDERLALERPGWRWGDDPKTFKDIVNPEETHIDELMKARRLDPDAKLVFSPENGPTLFGTFLGRYITRPAEPVTSGYGYSEEPF